MASQQGLLAGLLPISSDRDTANRQLVVLLLLLAAALWLVTEVVVFLNRGYFSALVEDADSMLRDVRDERKPKVA